MSMRQFIIFLCVLSSQVSFCQKGDTLNGVNMNKYQKVLMDDSTWIFVLKDFVKKERDSYYIWMASKVKRMYPFANHAVELLSDIDEDPKDETVSRSSKRSARKANKKLKEEFRQTILDMSESDGKVLVKLIHRETGMTAYEIIRKYRGKTKAIYWQALSKLGGADLKQTFNPKEDLSLNRVMIDVDSGKLKVPKEPKLLSKVDRKSKNKRIKSYRKAKRKADRKSKHSKPKENVTRY